MNDKDLLAAQLKEEDVIKHINLALSFEGLKVYTAFSEEWQQRSSWRGPWIAIIKELDDRDSPRVVEKWHYAYYEYANNAESAAIAAYRRWKAKDRIVNRSFDD